MFGGRCGFELFESLEGMAARGGDGGRVRDRYTWCVYTTVNGVKDDEGEPVRAVGFTDGPATVDERAGAAYSAKFKSEREAQFPLSLAVQALDIRLEDAQASVDKDRVHILNCMVGAGDLNAQPPDDHPAYALLNEGLRARFAAAALRAAIDAKLDALPRLLTALQAGRMTMLTLNLNTDKCDAETARSVVHHLPSALTVLKLRVHESVGAVVAKELAATLPMLPALKKVCILFACISFQLVCFQYFLF